MAEKWTFGNTPTELLTALAIASGFLLIASAVVAYARRKLDKAAETETEVDDFLLEVIRRTKVFLLFFVAVYLGSRAIEVPKQIASWIITLARLAVVAQIGFWLATAIDFALRRYYRDRTESDPAAVTTIRAFRFAALIAVWSLAFVAALKVIGADVTGLITGLGIGGVAIALATQNILGDLFASLSIVLDKPFVVGDFIRTGDDLGTVEKIGLKTTRLRSLTGEQLVFSNSDLLQSRIRNYKRMLERRIVFKIGVIYQTTAAQLEQIPVIVKEIIESAGDVRFDRGHFAAFGDSSYDFEFVYWMLAPDYNLYMDTQQKINLAIVRAFEAEGIEFAYPTRTLFIQGGSPAEGKG